MKTIVNVISALCAVAALPANAALTLVYSTNFNAPPYVDGNLVGQDSWAQTGTAATTPITVANTATNGTVTLATSGQDVNRIFTPASTAGSVYLAANIIVGSAQTTGDYFLHFGDGGTSNFNARTYIRSTTGGFQMALGTGSGAPTYGTTVLTFGTAYDILVRYDFVTGVGNDTGALFINPTTEDGSGDTAYVAATTIGTDAVTIGSVNLRQGAAANAAVVTIDNIVVSVPEPTSALLGALGFLAIFRRRR